MRPTDPPPDPDQAPKADQPTEAESRPDVDWTQQPDGGLAEFLAARKRFMEARRRESELYCLEKAWLEPAAQRTA